MGGLAIRAEGLAKRYRIGQARRGGDLREMIAGGIAAIASARPFGPRRGRPADFWALKGVSFDVEHGETLGIIGRNGAGKSTLLKVLSRITRPTTGKAEVRGRLGSLLEVGTGFHPDLNGRDNIFLNGAILGMKRAEIRARFDEIVAFAEIGPFLETPVKRYSSGMYVRLAFAVAAHLSSKILIIDEILAVGDSEFQQRCLGKMGSMARDGRTVLFVSHDLAAVRSLCRRAILLEGGRVSADAHTDDVIRSYLRSVEASTSTDLADRSDRLGAGHGRLVSVRVSAGAGEAAGEITTGRPLHFDFEYDRTVPAMACIFTIYDSAGNAIAGFNSSNRGPEDGTVSGRGATFTCQIDEVPLLPGRYRINVAMMSGSDLEDHVEGAATFEVGPGHLRGRPQTAHHGYGSVCIAHRWDQPAGRI